MKKYVVYIMYNIGNNVLQLLAEHILGTGRIHEQVYAL